MTPHTAPGKMLAVFFIFFTVIYLTAAARSPTALCPFTCYPLVLVLLLALIICTAVHFLTAAVDVRQPGRVLAAG